MYWGIPPEVNAFRLLNMGAGPGAHIPQVAGFQTAAATHLAQGTQMATTAAATSEGFVGAGGAAMMATAMPMAAWINAAGAHAEKMAATVQAGVDGYMTAAASTIAHPIVVANRVREQILEDTNIIGQNTIPIAEANAEYMEFWGQNAGAMMGYLSTILGLLPALATPLPPSPMGANPVGMAAGIAAVSAEGAATGVQALSAGVSEATQAASTTTGTGIGLASGAAGAAASAGRAGASQQGGGDAAPPAGAANGELDGQMLSQAQAIAGPMMSAPSQLAGATAPLSSVGQLPGTVSGQLGGLMGPMMSGLTGGLGGAPGGLSSGAGGVSTHWSGLGGSNGGYAGGGSPVSAALTKPSAGGGLAGPIGLPAAWWSGPAVEGRAEDKPVAGVRGGTAPTGAMGPGIYGMPVGAAGHGRGSHARDTADADKSIVLDGIAEGVPVLTGDGVVYTGDQGV